MSFFILNDFHIWILVHKQWQMAAFHPTENPTQWCKRSMGWAFFVEGGFRSSIIVHRDRSLGLTVSGRSVVVLLQANLKSQDVSCSSLTESRRMEPSCTRKGTSSNFLIGTPSPSIGIFCCHFQGIKVRIYYLKGCMFDFLGNWHNWKSQSGPMYRGRPSTTTRNLWRECNSLSTNDIQGSGRQVSRGFRWHCLNLNSCNLFLILPKQDSI